MPSILQIVSGTPAWVWVLFAFLVFLGISGMRPATAPLWRVAILPTIFFVWGLYSLYRLHGLALTRVLPWTCTLLVGIAVGIFIARLRTIKADKVRHLVRTEGGPLSLILILLIFATKYAFGYLHARQPGAFAEPRYWMTEIAVSGLLAGMFVGRFVGLWRQYLAAPHEELAS